MKEFTFRPKKAAEFHRIIADISNFEAMKLLRQVKEPPLIPSIEVLTKGQLEEYFGVDFKAIMRCDRVHFANGDTNDVFMLRCCDAKSVAVSCELDGRFYTMKFRNGAVAVMPAAGIKSYSPRAILQFAIYLTDSDIAEGLRKAIVRSRFNPYDHYRNFVSAMEHEEREMEAADETPVGCAMETIIVNGDCANEIPSPENHEATIQFIGLTPDILQKVVQSAVTEAITSLIDKRGEDFARI